MQRAWYGAPGLTCHRHDLHRSAPNTGGQGSGLGFGENRGF